MHALRQLIRPALVLLLVVPIATLTSARPLAAQGVTTAAVTGVVTAEDGTPLPGFQVVITHEETGATSAALTRADGRYTIQGLLPGGPYTLTASGLGYATQRREGIVLALSQTARIDFVLQTQAIQVAEVAVIAERSPVMSKDRTGAATTVGEEVIRRRPTITRDFTDFTRLTPQISASGGSTSAAGRNNRFNTIQIDGAVNNDLFGLAASGTPGGQAGTKPITLEAIKEFQVVLAPFDVRQGGFTGAGINAVTKSGTNEFHGSLSFFGRNEGLVGRYVLDNGERSAAVDDFSQNEIAFSLGGPIIRDRIHFFVAGEFSRRSAPSAFAIGKAGFPITQAEAEEIVDILNGYGYDAGEIGEVTLRRNSDNLFARLDFNLGQNHRLTLRHNWVDASDDYLPRSPNPYSLGNAGYEVRSTTHSTVAQLNSNFGGRYFNELRIGYSSIRDKRVVADAFPFVRIYLPGGPGGSRSIVAGAENFSVRNALDQVPVIELTNDFTFVAGRHNITVGTHNEFFSFSNLFVRNAFGNYTFDSIEDFRNGDPSWYELSYLLPGGRERAEFDVRQFSLYLQDQWDVTDRLTLTAGLRYDVTTFPDRPRYNPTVDSVFGRRTDEVPSGNGLLNPRLGFNWDVNGDRSLQLRGGLGLFSGRTPYVWISNAYGNTGLDYVRFTCSGKAQAPAFVPDPNAQPRSCEGSTNLQPNEINLVDPNFKFPQVFRASLAVDRQLPLGMVGTLEALYTRALNDVLYRELTVTDSVVGTAEGRNRYFRRLGGFSNVTDVTNTSENYSYSLTAQLQRAFDEWDFAVAYTFSRARDVNSTTSSQAFSNWRYNPVDGHPNRPKLRPSNFEIPHRIVAHGSYRAELLRNAPTDISLIYVGESGRPYSYVYAGDVNGDGSPNNDLIYVPKDASEVRFLSGDPVASWNALNEFIESVECLREARGRVLERNACREPWTHRIDVRLAQTLPLSFGHAIELTVDVLNFANLLNRDWGKSRFVPNQNDELLSAPGGAVPDAQGRVGVNPFSPRPKFLVSDLGSRYQIQVGARYRF